MTVYDLMQLCDDIAFGIDDGEYESWELEEMLNDSEEDEEDTREYDVRDSDLEDFEVSYIYGGKYGTVILQLEESLEDVLEYLREYA